MHAAWRLALVATVLLPVLAWRCCGPGPQDDAPDDGIGGGWDVHDPPPLLDDLIGTPGLELCGIPQLVDVDAGPPPEPPCPKGDFLFGPETFIRGTGREEPQVRAFSLSAAGPVCVEVDSDGNASAEVLVDALTVFDPSNFSAHPRILSKEVPLIAGPHAATVNLHGREGTALTLIIAKRLEDASEPPEVIPTHVLVGEKGKMLVTELTASEPAISPKNDDNMFEATALHAGFLVRRTDAASGNAWERHQFKFQSAIVVIDPATCRIVWSNEHEELFDPTPPPTGGDTWMPFRHDVAWDGVDNDNNFVADGVYLVVAVARAMRTQPSGTVHLIDRVTGPSIPVIVDNTPPELSVEAPAECSTDSSFTVSGTSEPGAVVTVKRAGVVMAEVETATDGTWNAQVSLDDNAVNNLSITARDAVYNVTSPPIEVSIIHDSRAPELTVDQPTNGQVVFSNTVAVTGTATDVNLREIRVQGDVVATGGSFATQVPVPLTGSLTIVVTAADCAGNTSQVERTVTASASCVTSAECESLLFDQGQQGACAYQGSCIDGKCRFTQLAAPGTFCKDDTLWLWSCNVKTFDGGARARQWSCDAGPTCEGDDGCTISRCVPGLLACEVTTADDDAPCAGGVASCADDGTLRVPTCQGGECISHADVACSSLVQAFDAECIKPTCRLYDGGAQCDPDALEGVPCSACTSGSLGACDPCTSGMVCSGAGLCEIAQPVACPSTNLCVEGFCDPYVAAPADRCQYRPYCPSETTCRIADGGPTCDVPDAGPDAGRQP